MFRPADVRYFIQPQVFKDIGVVKGRDVYFEKQLINPN